MPGICNANINEIVIYTQGTRWKHVGGRLKQIESGPNGAVWGVNRRGHIYFRAGISRGRPIGRNWVYIRGRRLNSVSPGCNGVFRLSSNGRIWRYRGRLKELAALVCI